MSQRSKLFPLLIVFLAAAPGLRLAAQPGPLAPNGPEVQLTGEADAFTSPSLAADPGGGLQLVWNRGLSFYQNEAWARHFDRGGHPSGPAVRLDTPAYLLRTSLTAMPLGPPGRSTALWINYSNPLSGGAPDFRKAVGDPSTVSARLLGADGLPLGGEIQLDTTGEANGYSLTAAPLSGGGFVASWSDYTLGTVVVRTFDAGAQPLGGEVVVEPHSYILGGLAAGGFLAWWQDPGSGGFARRFGRDGQPAGAAFAVDAGLRPVLRPDGSFVSATAQTEPGNSGIMAVTARLWDAAGHRLGTDIAVGDGVGELRVDSVAVSPSGDFLVVWLASVEGDAGANLIELWARLFDAAGHPAGPAVRVNSQSADSRFAAQAVTDGHDWVIGWTATTSGTFLARRFSSACATPDRTLCLQDSRFRVDVTWHDPRSGATGTASTIPQTSDTGGFWFFSPDNLELTVKVLDGRAVNGHFWVFYGSLSDVEFTVVVTDSATGIKKTYHNPPYNLASRADTAAF
ncbi:MAG TPA: hypothetical protein VH988_27375 [Thermoanaerobaculia bacterium]|jgi:hypothetical protein|nr:hypothetical protein [Thermoanaerobaculia bacterium]